MDVPICLREIVTLLTKTYLHVYFCDCFAFKNAIVAKINGVNLTLWDTSFMTEVFLWSYDKVCVYIGTVISAEPLFILLCIHGQRSLIAFSWRLVITLSIGSMVCWSEEGGDYKGHTVHSGLHISNVILYILHMCSFWWVHMNVYLHVYKAAMHLVVNQLVFLR